MEDDRSPQVSEKKVFGRLAGSITSNFLQLNIANKLMLGFSSLLALLDSQKLSKPVRRLTSTKIEKRVNFKKKKCNAKKRGASRNYLNIFEVLSVSLNKSY